MQSIPRSDNTTNYHGLRRSGGGKIRTFRGRVGYRKLLQPRTHIYVHVKVDPRDLYRTPRKEATVRILLNPVGRTQKSLPKRKEVIRNSSFLKKVIQKRKVGKR